MTTLKAKSFLGRGGDVQLLRLAAYKGKALEVIIAEQLQTILCKLSNLTWPQLANMSMKRLNWRKKSGSP
jgi:hypothetical protein